jgi:hypothetical protein
MVCYISRAGIWACGSCTLAGTHGTMGGSKQQLLLLLLLLQQQW